jgi:hypothetical protein
MKAIKDSVKYSAVINTIRSGRPGCDTILTTGTWKDHLNEEPIFNYSNNSVTLKFKVDGKIDGESYLKRTNYTESGWMGLHLYSVIFPEVVGDIQLCDNNRYYNDKNKKIVYFELSTKDTPLSTNLPEIEEKQQRLTFTFTFNDKLSNLENKKFKLLVNFVLEYRGGRNYYFYYP